MNCSCVPISWLRPASIWSNIYANLQSTILAVRDLLYISPHEIRTLMMYATFSGLPGRLLTMLTYQNEADMLSL